MRANFRYKRAPDNGRVATVGVFDGVHRGHIYLISQVRYIARERDMDSLVVTMDRHPREVLNKGRVSLLTGLYDKIYQLGCLRVDDIKVLHFTEEVASMTAREFMWKVLRKQFGVSVLVMGYDHHFGHNWKIASSQDYVHWGREAGIEVVVSDAMEAGGIKVSSSGIRRALSLGDVGTAAFMLGRYYGVSGFVVKGKHIGRVLGFPTANIEPYESDQMLPSNGVYAVLVDTPCEKKLLGMANIGLRPTIDTDARMTIEVHVLDREIDLYGQYITVRFIEKIRDTRKFENPRALQAQLRQDAADAVKILEHL